LLRLQGSNLGPTHYFTTSVFTADIIVCGLDYPIIRSGWTHYSLCTSRFPGLAQGCHAYLTKGSLNFESFHPGIPSWCCRMTVRRSTN